MRPLSAKWRQSEVIDLHAESNTVNGGTPRSNLKRCQTVSSTKMSDAPSAGTRTKPRLLMEHALAPPLRVGVRISQLAIDSALRIGYVFQAEGLCQTVHPPLPRSPAHGRRV